MVGKRNIFFIVAALILIPIMLGQTPVKFVQKLGSGCPLNQNKVALSCNPCIYHTVTSQDETGDRALVVLPTGNTGPDPAPLLAGVIHDFAVSTALYYLIEFPPLRC